VRRERRELQTDSANMKRHFPTSQIFLLIVLSAVASAQISTGCQHLCFRVTLSSELGNEAAEGRLIILLSNQREPAKVLEPEFGDHDYKVRIAAAEVSHLVPGSSVEVDPDVLAYPEPLSRTIAGDYQVMAVLDVNHHYAYNNLESGDLRSAVISLKHFDPASPQVIDLTLNERFHDQPSKLSASMAQLDFVSPSLSDFSGRPVHIRGIIVLPPGYAKNKAHRYPTVYWSHGFTGPFHYIQLMAANYSKGMSEGKLPEMIYVMLDQECPGGTHEFADSANNGPWGKALTKELIPYLEHKYRMDSKPSGRLLTGHSSGGWAALWLQVTYPTLFGGTWPTAPDPADFRNFTGPNLLKDKNFYHKPDGTKWMLVRSNGKDVFSLEEASRMERVLGDYGGQISSFEWVFSPRGPDGRPQQLFDRDTGDIHPEIAQAWEKYDIATILRTQAAKLRPLLQDKIHLSVGTADTFHLDEAALLLEEDLKELGIHAQINFLPGKDHADLYEGGLREQIAKEMEDVARPPRSKARQAKPH